ncbi:MAG: glutaredoxin family protein [Methylococcales bacterium]|jgi:hypothetical protein|nr:glutaredoxin family protein [Methylococcales bacterium]
MLQFLLLGTSGCHLCEQAEQITNEYLSGSNEVVIEIIDIAEQEQWQALYSLRIPVLYHTNTSKELGWPFDLMQVKQFITDLSQD